jgi:hypothetical protein
MLPLKKNYQVLLFNKQWALFLGEISALKLAANARITIEKFKNDYKVCSFYNHNDWRVSRDAIDNSRTQKPQAHAYKIIIQNSIIFHPSITGFMKQNIENLADYLFSILRLKPDIKEEGIRNILKR